MKNKDFGSPPTASFESLQDSGVLTSSQVALLIEKWPLGDEWAVAHPYFKGLREHTVTYIDRLRGEKL